MTATEVQARQARPITTASIRRIVDVMRANEERSQVDMFYRWAYGTKKPKNHQYELDFEPKYVKWEHKVIFDSITMEEL